MASNKLSDFDCAFEHVGTVAASCVAQKAALGEHCVYGMHKGNSVPSSTLGSGDGRGKSLEGSVPFILDSSINSFL